MWSQTHRRLKNSKIYKLSRASAEQRGGRSDKFTAPVFTTRPTLFFTPRVYAMQRFRLYSAILASTEQGQEAAPLDESSSTKESLYAMGRCYCRFFRLRR